MGDVGQMEQENRIPLEQIDKGYGTFSISGCLSKRFEKDKMEEVVSLLDQLLLQKPNFSELFLLLQ